MKELLKEIWLSQIKGKAELKEIIRKYGIDEVKDAETKGFIRVRGEKVELTEKGRKRIKVVLAGGVFDILHPGHVFFLSKAGELGTISSSACRSCCRCSVSRCSARSSLASR